MSDVIWRLYWCWTADHDEDWFVVARNAREARRFHEDEEGYDRGDADSRFIARIPRAHAMEYARWPDRAVLEACGGIVERWLTPRVVVFERLRYCEGMLQHELDKLTDDLVERRGHGRPNRTVRSKPS